MSSRVGSVVLVTGGAGFIGGNLCRDLLTDPWVEEVRVLDDLSSGSLTNIDGLDVSFTRGTVLDEECLGEVMHGCTHVVHLAAVPSVPRSIADPLRSHEVNATGSVRVLDMARRMPDLHVTIASSSSVYGANPVLPKSESLQTQPMSPYAVSKLAAEQYAVAFARCYGLQVLPLRFFNVYGPLQPAGHAYAAVVPAFVDALLHDRPLVVFGDGTQTRDFTFVDTVTAVLRSAVRRRVSAGPVNLAFGRRNSLRDLLALLATITGREPQVEHRAVRAGDVPHSQADHRLVVALFPEVRPVPLRAGLERTVSWARTLQPA